MKIVISNGQDIPIYEQIKEQIKKQIMSGNIKENEILPSIRQLAKDLKISIITTNRAYTDLEEEGFVKNVQGKGCYVLPINTNMVKEQMIRSIEENLTSAVQSAQISKISKKELLDILELICKEENYE